MKVVWFGENHAEARSLHGGGVFLRISSGPVVLVYFLAVGAATRPRFAPARRLCPSGCPCSL